MKDSDALVLPHDPDSDEDRCGEKCISILSSLLPEGIEPPPISPFLEVSEFVLPNPGGDIEMDPTRAEVVEEEDLADENPCMEEAIAPRLRPSIPPKPTIDAVRYSMNNVKESSDWQLDALLEELEQLGSALDSPSGGDQFLMGMPTLPKKEPVVTKKGPPPREPPKEPPAAPPKLVQTRVSPSSCSSPDGDSAFGEGSSTESASARCRHSAVSSNDSCRESLNTPSPTQVSPAQEESKEQKIREALLKMKEANITRIFVKFFVDDGAPMQILVDERWTVAETMQQLADKHQIALHEDHCLVEEIPDLLIRRIYEDHENLVENIKMWVDGSKNKLYLTRRPDKYPFVERPELYLVTDKTTDLDIPHQWSLDVKREFVHDYFSRDNVTPPELDGELLLKADGKKAWRKCYFVLRPSGLYCSPKGKKASKDLQCLMNLHSNQVYTGFDWKKKYKAPTEYCISIKLTQLQMKRSTYIKYICAEDEMTFKKWLTALRIAKNGRLLYQNYTTATEKRLAVMGAVPRKVDVPRVDSQASHRSQLDCSASISSSSSRQDMLSTTSSYHSNRVFPHHERASSAAGSSNGMENSGHSRAPSTVTTASNSVLEVKMYDEQPTGTIKRAPVDVIRRVPSSHLSHSSVDEEDSDEETFPAPPPSIHSPARSTVSEQTRSSVSSPVPPPKPPLLLSSTPLISAGAPPLPPVRLTPIQQQYATIQKKVPPPPPKRAENTQLQSTPTQHMSELEAALGRRRQKIEPV